MKILLNCLLAPTVLLLIFTASAYSQTTNWETKPVDKWDKDDLKVILEKSPWSKFILAKPGSNTFIGTIVLDKSYTFTLRSAIPVRLALLRNLQLKAKYDAMDAKKQSEFDSANKSILTCSLCDKFYIISVNSDSRILQNRNLVRNRNVTLSNEKGETRPLQDYSPPPGPTGESMFFFPRFDKAGKPLFTKENSKLVFSIESDPDDDPIVFAIRRVEIDIKDIIREDTVIF